MDLSLINTQTRCNSIVLFWIDIYNSGAVPENVRCYFVKDTLIGFARSTPAVTATSGDTLFWDFNAFAPFSHHQILLQLQMPNQNNTGDTTSQNKNFDLMITDLYGRQVYHAKETGDFVSVATSKIGGGVFIYRITDESKKVYIGKIILIK